MVRRTGAWPTPWKRVDEDVDPEEVEWCEVVDANDECVPFIGDLQYEVDQDQITAVDTLIAIVNHYPALLAAARAVAGYPATRVRMHSPGAEWMVEIPVWMIDALRAAVEANEVH